MKSSESTRPQKVDIHTVAKHAGVSIATVSRALNQVPTVDPALASRVWKAVRELNYTPNTQARALVSGKSRLMGLIVSDITNPFFPELIQEFERASVEHGYEILIASTSHDPRKMERSVQRMLQRNVDGVAIMTFGFEEKLLDRFAKGTVPVVFMDVGSKRLPSSFLSVDYRTGIHEGVQHLAVLGHRKIAFISGPRHLYSAQVRKSAFLESLRATGLTANPDWLIEGDHTLEGGRAAMEQLLKLESQPTAVMCSNDVTAIGVQHALFDANLKVPDDLSLIGFDDIHLAEYTIPPLTTVRMSCHDIAEKAVRNLLAHIQKPAGEPVTEEPVPTRLVVRQTTALPKNALSDLQTTRKGTKQ